MSRASCSKSQLYQEPSGGFPCPQQPHQNGSLHHHCIRNLIACG